MSLDLPHTDDGFEKRFFEKIKKNENGCWIWVGSLNKGYGQTYYNGRLVKAHRASYRHFRGIFNTKYHVDHLCGTPACVNPDHLSPCSPEENISRREGGVGRKTIGQRVTIVLTEDQIEWIEAQLVPGRLSRSEAIRRILDKAMMSQKADWKSRKAHRYETIRESKDLKKDLKKTRKKAE